MWDHLEQLVQDGKLSKFDVSRIAEICGIICITPVAEEVKRIRRFGEMLLQVLLWAP